MSLLFILGIGNGLMALSIIRGIYQTYNYMPKYQLGIGLLVMALNVICCMDLTGLGALLRETLLQWR